MKSKSAVVTLSFLFGSTGAGRFYLGQNQSGWTLLLLWWLLLPGLIYAIIRFNLAPSVLSLYGSAILLQVGITLVILFHIVESLRFILMKPEKFKSQDRSTRNTIPLTLLSIVLGGALYVASGKLISDVRHVDITKTDAELVLSTEQMSQEFRANEDEYRKKYDNRVLQVEGVASLAPGEDFETGTMYLELAGHEGDAFGIKCFFLKENSKGVNKILPGDSVVVKGECNGNILNNCLLIEVKKKK